MKESELGDVVLVDADKNSVSTEYDDLDDLPAEIVSSWTEPAIVIVLFFVVEHAR